jgi:DNA repair exonuclease SbcCD ATPase subunit
MDGVVVEYILLICAGFLIAVLLALLIAPSIWRRAVFLTEKRIRATVPLTLEEVRAEKDKLRAEFAMTARRHEMRIEDLLGRTAELLAENATGEEEILSLREDRARKSERIAEIETELEIARSEFASQGEELDNCIADLKTAEAQIENKQVEIEHLERELTEASLSASNFQIDLAAAETDVERLREQLREMREHVRVSEDRAKGLASDLRLANEERKAGAKRLADTEARLESTNSAVISLEEKLERRDSELKRLREEAKERSRLVSHAERNFDLAAKQIAKFEREQEQIAALFDLPGDQKPGWGELKKMVSRLKAERDGTAKKLESAVGDKARLQDDIAELRQRLAQAGGADNEGASELREKIGDIAARVVYMTSKLEGAESPILDVLRKPEQEQAGRANGTSMPSLAERIRSLQKAPAATQ